jgi:hypothetical protein
MFVWAPRRNREQKILKDKRMRAPQNGQWQKRHGAPKSARPVAYAADANNPALLLTSLV